MSSVRTGTPPSIATDLASTGSVGPDDGDSRYEWPLVDAARQGDRAAWEHIYRLFGPPLTRYAASRGISDPEDVTQDVMYAAASQIDRFTGGEDNLRSWLFTIAYRRCADHHRRRHRRPEQPTDRLPDDLEPCDSADTDIWADGEGREAFAALDILTERERDVVTLRIIGELGTGDVADALALSTTNVRVIQSRALAKLRRHLEGNGGFLDRRFRSVSVLLAIATEKMGAMRRLRDMRETLPSDGRLGAWVESLRSDGSPTPPALAATAEAAAEVASATTVAGGAAATAFTHISAAVVIAAGVVIGGAVPHHAESGPPPPASSAPSDTVRHQPGGPEGVTTGPDDPAQHRADMVTPVVLGLPDGDPISIPGAAVVSEVDVLMGDAEVTDDLDPVGSVEQTQVPRRVQETAEQIDVATLPDPEGTTGDRVATDAEEVVDAGTVDSEPEATSTTAPVEHVTPESATDLAQDAVDSSAEDEVSAGLDG